MGKDYTQARHEGYKKGRKEGYKHGYRNGTWHSEIPKPVSRKSVVLLAMVAAVAGFLVGLLF